MIEAFRSEPATQSPESKNEQLVFPWGEAAMDLYRDHCKETGKSPEIMERVVQEFFRSELENMQLSTSEDGTAFPYTYIRVGDLARRMLGGIPPQGTQTGQIKNPETPRLRRVEFVAGSFLNTSQGHAFGYCEEAIHKMMMSLPGALRALREGKESEDIVVCTLGSPTNEYGKMSSQFAADVKSNPYMVFGTLYADFVKREVLDKRKPNEKIELTLTGFSMGSNFMTEAAQVLSERGLVTQDKSGDDPRPRVSVNAYIPAGFNDSLLRPAQVPVGFVADLFIEGFTNSTLRKTALGEAQFSGSLKDVFSKRGITPSMDAEQEKLKSEGLKSILLALTFGPSKPSTIAVNVNKIEGLRDPTTLSLAQLLSDALHKRKEVRTQHGVETSAAKTLGAHVQERGKEGNREFAVKMSHAIPFFRESEWRRWDRVTDELGTSGA